MDLSELHVRHFTTAELVALNARLELIQRIEWAVDRPHDEQVQTEQLRATVVGDLQIPRAEASA